MSESPQVHTIVCEEVFDENSVPSEEEVLEYAAKIGIDTKTEHHLLPIALNGLMHPLPPEWKPCYDQELKKWYYYNLETKRSQWEHPLDPLYRQIVKRGRSEGYSSAGDDDSKTTAKEDLKSFEEASDILSSRSVDIKPEAGIDKKDNIVMSERGPLLKGSQPLLLRRKQLQSGQDPLHVAKLINSTLRQNLPKDEDPPIQRRSLSDLPTPAPALRRSHTSDLITTHPPPIKGILRESSFSGSMTSSNKVSSVKYGDAGSLHPDTDDEKKRSVRFADFERKSLDIRFQLSDSEEMYSDVEDDEEDEPSSGSPEAEKDIKEVENELKPKILSPLKKSDNPFNFVLQKKDGTDQPRPLRKFTVTPVTLKDPPFGYPVSDLKGLFRRESVGPLDSDSDLSSGMKGAESLTTGISRLNDADSSNLKKAQTELDLSNSPVNGSPKSPVKLTRPEDSDGRSLRSPTTLINIHDSGMNLSSPGSDLRKVMTESAIDLTEYVSAVSIQGIDSLETLSKNRNEELSVLEDKLNKELEEKTKHLRSLQENKLTRFKEDLMKNEDIVLKKLKEELEDNLEKLKENLRAEYKLKENDLRDLHKLELNNLSKQLELEREREIAKLREENQEIIRKWKNDEEEALKEERIRIDNDVFERVQKNKAELIKKLDEIKSQEEAQIAELTEANEKRLEEMKLKYEEIVKELNLRHQNEIKEIEESHKLRINVMTKDKETELKRCEGEWEDRLTALTLSQKARMDSIGKEYEGRLARLKADWEREEAEMRRRRVPFDQQALPVDYEKLRCEKRLLEDKYRTLKEKYCQLKTDMKIAVEKKLQARAKRKKEELERVSGQPERPKNLNTELVPASLNTPRITVGEVSPRDVTDPSSDDQYTLSSTVPEKYGSHRRSRSQRYDHTPTGSHEARSHLEDLDEKSADSYLHHPLNSLGLSRSSEIDYYRQRLIAEEEQARTTRESLDETRRCMETRGTMENNNTLLGLHQVIERDLNELEVSLHRTKQFFGEKMIRLRLLGQTLSRLADDTTSPPYAAGESCVATSNVLQNLDNINAEIREIWNQLNKNQPSGVNNTGGLSEVRCKNEEKPRSKSSHHHQSQSHRSSKRSEIQARLQGLQDWLQAPPTADWAQLTL
ncbi:centrosomal protein of 164 kDa isoform X1 [Halyomorpha halys]|uniref:centrosomal protein of 164 kDa isoform X1 n=2 Tax=Halyomorpha halys TaxID=286706 RepID=UPI0034D2BDF6